MTSTTPQKALLALLGILTAVTMIVLPSFAMASEGALTGTMIAPPSWITPALVSFGSIVAIAIPALLIGGGLSVRNRAALEQAQNQA